MKRIEVTAIVRDDMPKVAWLLFLHREKGDIERYEELAVKDKKTGEWKTVRAETSPMKRLGDATFLMGEGIWKFFKGLIQLVVASVKLALSGIQWIWKKPGETIFDNVKKK